MLTHTRPALLPALFALPLLACGAAPTPRASPSPPGAETPLVKPTLAATPTPGIRRASKPKAATPGIRRASKPKAAPATAPKTRIAATAATAAPADAAPRAVAGGKHLARLHPEVRRMALALHAEAAAAGIELKFISGYRKFRRNSRKARLGRASWHSFGMAFDVNLADRRGMSDALAHFDADRRRWDRVGAIAERLGLTWGLQWGEAEVFHFEWHPGMPDAIRRPTLNVLLEHAGPEGKAVERVWTLFDADGEHVHDHAVAHRDE